MPDACHERVTDQKVARAPSVPDLRKARGTMAPPRTGGHRTAQHTGP